MDEGEDPAKAPAHQHRPGQGRGLPEGLFYRTSPKLFCGEIDHADDQCHSCTTGRTGEQGHQAEAEFGEQGAEGVASV